MSPAKRTTSTPPAKRASTRTKKAMEREIALPSESDQTQGGSVTPIESFSGDGAGDDMEERIRQRAYQIYCSRNGDGGDALEDWLAAEREVRSGGAGTAPERHASMLLESSSEGDGRDVAR